MKPLQIFLLSLLLSMLAIPSRAQQCILTGRFSADSTKYFVQVDGKEITFPLWWKDEYGLYYYLEETFTEHDTLFFYRDYEIYYCDTCPGGLQEWVSNYFLVPSTSPNFIDNVKRNFEFWSPDEDKEYFDQAFKEMLEACSDTVISRQNLGNIPRIWYPLVKFNEEYYLSADYPYPFEFTDSLLVYHGMELYFFPIRNFKKISRKEYRYEYYNYGGSWIKVTLHRSKKIKNLWLQITENENACPSIEFVTPNECAGSFNFINYHSNSHIGTGLTLPHLPRISIDDF